MATPSLARGGHRTPYILRSNMLGQRGGFFAVPFCLENGCPCNAKGLHQLLHILPSAREEGHHFAHFVNKMCKVKRVICVMREGAPQRSRQIQVAKRR